jgi:hypothetical protein
MSDQENMYREHPGFPCPQDQIASARAPPRDRTSPDSGGGSAHSSFFSATPPRADVSGPLGSAAQLDSLKTELLAAFRTRKELGSKEERRALNARATAVLDFLATALRAFNTPVEQRGHIDHSVRSILSAGLLLDARLWQLQQLAAGDFARGGALLPTQVVEDEDDAWD